LHVKEKPMPSQKSRWPSKKQGQTDSWERGVPPNQYKKMVYGVIITLGRLECDLGDERDLRGGTFKHATRLWGWGDMRLAGWTNKGSLGGGGRWKEKVKQREFQTEGKTEHNQATATKGKKKPASCKLGF